MCNELFFQALNTSCNTEVRVATNAPAKVEGVGSIILNVTLDRRKPGAIRLGNALYVPQLQMYLLSSKQPRKERALISIRPGIIALKNIQITCAPNVNHLCILQTNWLAQAALSILADVTLDLLHRRFEHASKSVLLNMQKETVV